MILMSNISLCLSWKELGLANEYEVYKRPNTEMAYVARGNPPRSRVVRAKN